MTARSQGLQAEAVIQRIRFRGHPLVRATHRTTIEITTEGRLTESGDCIVGVLAETGCGGLEPPLKDALRRKNAMVEIRIVVGSVTFALTATGSPGLELSHPHDIVIRKSDFQSNRTLAIGASAAAKDIPRGMVESLKSPGTVGCLEVEVA